MLDINVPSRGTTPPPLLSSLPSVHSHTHSLTPGRDYADAVEGRIYARWKSRYGASVTAVVKQWRWMLNMFSTFASRARTHVHFLWKTPNHFFFQSFSVFFPSSFPLPAAGLFFFFLSSPPKRIMFSAVRNLQNYLVSETEDVIKACRSPPVWSVDSTSTSNTGLSETGSVYVTIKIP